MNRPILDKFRLKILRMLVKSEKMSLNPLRGHIVDEHYFFQSNSVICMLFFSNGLTISGSYKQKDASKESVESLATKAYEIAEQNALNFFSTLDKIIVPNHSAVELFRKKITTI